MVLSSDSPIFRRDRNAGGYSVLCSRCCRFCASLLASRSATARKSYYNCSQKLVTLVSVQAKVPLPLDRAARAAEALAALITNKSGGPTPHVLLRLDEDMVAFDAAPQPGNAGRR